MTDTPRGASEIADYRLEVERHLADLPVPARDDLLADLETHLTEVAAELEPGAALADRLGSPEDYARELRETAGATGQIERPRSDLRAWADRYTTSAGVGGFAEFCRLLRPGWWVLRGVLCAVLVLVVMGGFLSSSDMPLARDIVNAWPLTVIVFAASALVLVWVSVRLGARSAHQGPRLRGAVAVGGFVVAVIALWGAVTLVGDYWSDEFGNDWGHSGSVNDVEAELTTPWPEDAETGDPARSSSPGGEATEAGASETASAESPTAATESAAPSGESPTIPTGD